MLKRNKMLFGQKSEKGKFICDGQIALDGSMFNEAEAESNPVAAEPNVETITKQSKKTGQHRGRKEIRADLESKKVVFELPENQQTCDVCGSPLTEYTEEYLTTRIAVIPEKLYKIEYYRKVYKCKNCDQNGLKSNIVKAENKTPAPVIEKGADASAAVMSIIETAKRNNLDVYGYLLYLLTVLPEMGTDPTEDQIKSVMPWSFALPAYCRQTYSEIQ